MTNYRRKSQQDRRLRRRRQTPGLGLELARLLLNAVLFRRWEVGCGLVGRRFLDDHRIGVAFQLAYEIVQRAILELGAIPIEAIAITLAVAHERLVQRLVILDRSLPDDVLGAQRRGGGRRRRGGVLEAASMPDHGLPIAGEIAVLDQITDDLPTLLQGAAGVAGRPHRAQIRITRRTKQRFTGRQEQDARQRDYLPSEPSHLDRQSFSLSHQGLSAPLRRRKRNLILG
jgi:hypothetical protein